MSAISTPQHSAATEGVQDRSGWGLLGMAVGILLGFYASFAWIVPLFPKDKTTMSLILLTTIVVVAMTMGGAIGYLTTRRKA